MGKSLTRAINEAIDDRERASTQEAPTVDELGIVTAGTTITTDVPDLSDLDDRELVAMPKLPDEPEEPDRGEEEEPEADEAPDDDRGEEEEPVAEALMDPDYETEFRKRDRYSDSPEDLAAHGGMAKPGKMPCITYSMLAGGLIDPATVARLKKKGVDPELLGVRGMCPQGTKLSRIPGSVCYGCYAFGGNYLRPNVITALARRAKATQQAVRNPKTRERWIKAIVSSAERSGNKFFRWHDSGDIRGQNHLEAIVEVARRKPDVKFWLPTKEHGTVRNWISTYGAKSIPRNLTIRLSAHMLFEKMNAAPPLTTSSVDSGEGFACPATHDERWQQRYQWGSGNKRSPTCGPCRACWDRNTRNVDYAFHGAKYRYRQGLLVHGLTEPQKGTTPEKPADWTPAPTPQAAAMKGVLPKSPGPVKKVIRPD